MTRIQALAAIVSEEHADAMLLSGEVNLIYTTSCTALEGKCLILADGSAFFVTDGRYAEVADAQLTPHGFQVIVPPQTVGLYNCLNTLITEHHVGKLLYEDDVLTVDQFALLRDKFSACTFLPIGRHIRNLRAEKSAEEIDCIIRAQRIAEAALHRLLPELHEGMTEREAAARLNYYMALGGSEKPSFDTILLFGENTSKPHGVPSDRALRRGDFVLADFGAVYHGYHSDMTRTVAFGEPTEEMRKVYGIVRAAQDAAQAAATVGRLCCEMHAAAVAVIEQAGYGQYFTHALGHSVGLEIHEMPVAALRCEEPLRDGIVITDEPGIYMPGKFGVRIEDMLVINGDTARNITEFPKELTVIG